MIKLVNIKNDEKITIFNKIYDNNAPEKIYIPVNPHMKINDYIYKNLYFENYISSISGIVSNIKNIKINKSMVECFEIVNDYKENIKQKHNKEKINNKEELINVLIKYHRNDLVNKIVNQEKIKNLVISSIDEEIYSIKELIRLSNNYTEIIDVIDFLMEIFNINNSILVVKDTNSSSIKNVKSIIGTYPKIKIILAPDRYLISHKDFLCEFLNIKDDDTLLLTTTEIYEIYNILNGKCVCEKLITISGNALAKSIVINAKLGVSLKELIQEYVEIIEEDIEVYINGYLKGYKINDFEEIITEDIDYVVINKKQVKEISECINCGACRKICPYKINVKLCYLKKMHHKKCIGCGLCNFICPANINLKEIVKSDDCEKNINN